MFTAGLLLGGLTTFSSVNSRADEPVPTTKPATIPSTAPATAPTTNAAAPATQRSRDAIVADISAANQEMRDAIPSFEIFASEKKRSEAAVKAVPAMKKFLASLRELAALDPRFGSQYQVMRSDLLTMMTVLGDADSEKQLTTFAAGQGRGAAAAKAALLHAHWWRSSDNAAAQTKMVDEAAAILKAAPGDSRIAAEIEQMCEIGAATPELALTIGQLVIDNATGPGSESLKERVETRRAFLALRNKPLAVAGVTVAGKPFTTADWKGKVVLVDFWATWCPPCRAELPGIKKMYEAYHDKGLEIVGVSSDYEEKVLTTFLAENKDMPWPQLFDEKAAGSHPLMKQLGIASLPAMFLIDRKGIVRSISAQDDFEELIPKLIDEK